MCSVFMCRILSHFYSKSFSVFSKCMQKRKGKMQMNNACKHESQVQCQCQKSWLSLCTISFWQMLQMLDGRRVQHGISSSRCLGSISGQSWRRWLEVQGLSCMPENWISLSKCEFIKFSFYHLSIFASLSRPPSPFRFSPPWRPASDSVPLLEMGRVSESWWPWTSGSVLLSSAEQNSRWRPASDSILWMLLRLGEFSGVTRPQRFFALSLVCRFCFEDNGIRMHCPFCPFLIQSLSGHLLDAHHINQMEDVVRLIAIDVL